MAHRSQHEQKARDQYSEQIGKLVYRDMSQKPKGYAVYTREDGVRIDTCTLTEYVTKYKGSKDYVLVPLD